MICTICKRSLRSVAVTVQGFPPVCGNARCLGEAVRRAR